MSQGPSWKWLLVPLGAIPAVCCVFGVIGVLAQRFGEKFERRPGVEPAGRFALEGPLIGVADGTWMTAALVTTDDVSGERVAQSVRARARDGRFRFVASAPAHVGELSMSLFTDDRQGGTVHTTIGGNSQRLAVASGDRLVGIRIDLYRGLSFQGTVRDAHTHAPLAGVAVSAVYQRFGRDGWSPPQEVAVSDAQGRWTLHGVRIGRLVDQAHPKLFLWVAGYRELERAVESPAPGAIVTVDAELEPTPAQGG